MKPTQDLIAELAGNVAPIRRVLTPLNAALIWLVVAFFYGLFVVAALGPFRAGALQDLAAWRFLLESVAALTAITALGYGSFLLAVPGRRHKPWLVLGWCALGLWIVNLLFDLVQPALAVSMAGKRTHCALEAYLGSVPAALLAGWLISRRYALRPVATIFHAATAAGLIPAFFMQFACIHIFSHVLLFHLVPALSVPLVFACITRLGALATERRRSLRGFRAR